MRGAVLWGQTPGEEFDVHSTSPVSGRPQEKEGADLKAILQVGKPSSEEGNEVLPALAPRPQFQGPPEPSPLPSLSFHLCPSLCL